MSQLSKHAIIYGASGLIGWALVNELLGSYPYSSSFSKVTAVTNRPLNLSESHWPDKDSRKAKLQLVSGIDLRNGDGTTLAEGLKEAINDVENVTHVFYLVFSAADDDIEEVTINRHMFKNVIDAHTLVSPNLQFVTFPGGTRGYGIYLPGGTFTPPLTENMVDNLPADYAKTVVYPTYRELLNTASHGKNWTWCEVCPDAIVGFTPNGSQFSLALHWAQYLSLYAYSHGIGPHTKSSERPRVEVPFPGNSAGANSLFTPVASNTIGRFMIYASLNPDKCGDGQLFNIADSETPCKYGELWTELAKWFGLVGVGPVEDSNAQKDTLRVGELPQTAMPLTPGEYVTKYQDTFTQCGCDRAVSGGVGVGRRQLDSVGYWLTFDRQMSLEKLKKTGFDGYTDPVSAWLDTFAMFRAAGLIL